MAASQAHPSPFPRVAAYGINSILYQRGIYPPETFTRVQKYGLTLLVTTDPELKNYLNNVVEQMKGGGAGPGELRGLLQTATVLPMAGGCSSPLGMYLMLLLPCTATNCCGFFQSGFTSALCSAWWW